MPSSVAEYYVLPAGCFPGVSFDVNPEDEVALLLRLEGAGDDAVFASGKPHPLSKL